VTVREAAVRLELGLSTVYDLIARGRLGAYRHGGTYRVAEADLVAYLASARVRANEPARTPVKPAGDWRAAYRAREARRAAERSAREDRP
jgi:excisionase family DNA binding protein